MIKFLYKSFMMLITTILSTDPALILMGWGNKYIFDKQLSTVTLFYFANNKYLESQTFAWYAKNRRWRPVFGGLYFQRHNCGAICVLGCTEEEFTDPKNKHLLLSVERRMRRIGKLLGASTVSYSGILPSALVRIGVKREPVEITRTIYWISKAIEVLRFRCSLPADTPIVVIGAAGFVGSRVVEILRSVECQQVIEIDPHHPNVIFRQKDGLFALKGRRIIILNISRNHVIESYAPDLWEGVFVLNEVYPECDNSTLELMKKNKVRYFHIAGVKARSLPGFPRAYAGAVPCCAASAVISGVKKIQPDDAEELLINEQ